MTDSVVDANAAEVKQATKYVKETENVAEKYSAMTVSKNSSDVNMNVGDLPSAAFTAVPTLKSVKKVRGSRGSRAITHLSHAGRGGHMRGGISRVRGRTNPLRVSVDLSSVYRAFFSLKVTANWLMRGWT